MKKENQKFEGVLMDKELYLIEDALEKYNESDNPVIEKRIRELILKLYSEFYEKETATGNYSETGSKAN